MVECSAYRVSTMPDTFSEASSSRAATPEGPALAERIVAARQELGSFSSLDEVVVFAQIEDGAAARIRDYALLLRR